MLRLIGLEFRPVSNGTKKGLFVVFDDAVNHWILVVFVRIHEPNN